MLEFSFFSSVWFVEFSPATKLKGAVISDPYQVEGGSYS